MPLKLLLPDSRYDDVAGKLRVIDQGQGGRRLQCRIVGLAGCGDVRMAFRIGILLGFLACLVGARDIFAQGGPPGGLVRDLAVSPNDPATLYAATGNGLYKSVDAGETWTKTSLASGAISNPAIAAVAIDPASPGVLYAGTDSGVFKTTNAGVTWTFVLSFISVVTLTVDPLTPTTVYAGSLTFGIRKSIDSGSSWTSANTGLTAGNVFSIYVSPFDSSMVFAGTGNGGAFRSTNGGANWVSVNTGIPVSHVRKFAIDSTNASIVYAGTYGAGVYKSVDSGTTWAPANSGYTSDFVNALVFDPSNPGVLYSVAGTILVSTDGALSWSALTPPAPAGSVFSVALHPLVPGTIYAGGSKGVFRLSSGAWKHTSAGLAALAVNALLLDPSSPPTVYAGTGAGPYKTTNGGISWTTGDIGGSAFSIAISPADRSTVYMGTSSGVAKTTNGGANWILANSGLPIDAIKALGIDPANPNTLYAGTEDNGVFKSMNGGEDWIAMNSGLTNLHVRALAVNPKNPSTVYVGVSGAGVFKSVDGGANWNAAPGVTSMFAGEATVNAIAIDPSAPDTIYVGVFAGGVSKTTDGGSTWTRTLGSQTINAIAIDPTFPSVVYAGGALNVPFLKSINGGASWSSFSTGYTFSTTINAIAVDLLTSAVYVGTSQYGVYKIGADGSGQPTKANFGSGAPPATVISKVHGDGQRGAAGGALRYPLVVLVTNAAGVPVSGVNVTFMVASGDGTLSGTHSTTDSQGIAFTSLALGNNSATTTISVSAGDLTGSPLMFTASVQRTSRGQILSQ
jgi:ligand-binding sensor domain-containing protein